MDKSNIIQKYKKEDERLLVSKLLDKIQAIENQNKIQYTDFLNSIEIVLLEKVLKMTGFKNYIIYGGNQNSQRKLIIMFPSKLENIFNENNFDFNTIINCIRIQNLDENIEHKNILGGLIKLGVKREKIGDIIIHNNNADVVVAKEITKFLMSNLSQLTRFKNANIDVIKISEMVSKEQVFEDMKIMVSSFRLDNIVSELAKTSRSKSIEIINQERVFVNYESEMKATKLVKEKDIITIRGKGKFIIDEIVANTRSGRFVINVKKYV